MGYSHYWHRPEVLDRDRFNKLCDDMKELLSATPQFSQSAGGYYSDIPITLVDVEIAESHGDGKSAIIVFDGLDEEGEPYCSFALPQILSPEEYAGYSRNAYGVLQWCKTARLPYDVVVCAALMRVRHYFGEVLVQSDGKAKDWEDAVRLYRTVFGEALPEWSGPWIAGWKAPKDATT